MQATAPGDVIRHFAHALERGDLDGMLSLYEPDATFAPSPGETVSGSASIKAALETFLALSPRMSGEIEKVLVAGDTALVANRWSLRGTSPEGDAIEMRGTSADVLRRKPDGSWRIAIDDPWGAGAG
jgi:uncharacterized protein (TIGR02246 family)